MKTPTSNRLGPSPTHVHHNRRARRPCCLPCLIILVLLLILTLTVVILALTVFKLRTPTTTLLSTTISGISPRVTLPAVQISLNISLSLRILIHNPNRAAFSHSPGTTLLYYREVQVGEADVAAGRIPARGEEVVGVELTVEAGKVTSELGSLVSDVLAGSVGFDTVTRMPGRVEFLGFIKHHAVATSECHVVVGVATLKVQSQECKQKTKL